MTAGAIRLEAITVSGFAIPYDVPILEYPTLSAYVPANHILVLKVTSFVVPDVPVVLTVGSFVCSLLPRDLELGLFRQE